MTTLPLLAFFGGIGATFLVFPFWSSIVWKQKKEGEKAQGKLLIDLSALLDPRLLDLASSGLLDGRLILPHSLLKTLYFEAGSEDENERSKAKKGLEHFKRLETMADLDLAIIEEAPSKMGDSFLEMLHLAKALEAHLVTSDASMQEPSPIVGVRVINLHGLTQFFKSPIQGGERLSLKIQRIGKEIGQGIGYLEDGTMVVVNGAAHLIGEMVEAVVLSIKHNTAGRMVFCNTKEEQARVSEGGIDRRKRELQN